MYFGVITYVYGSATNRIREGKMDWFTGLLLAERMVEK
jgi:hypothetical protein